MRVGGTVHSFRDTVLTLMLMLVLMLMLMLVLMLMRCGWGGLCTAFATLC